MSIRFTAMLLSAAILLGAAAPAPARGGLEGDWRNTKNSVHLRVAPCGAALCGTVTWANDEQRERARKGSGQDIVGRQLLRDLKSSGDGSWTGKVFVPSINSNGSATIKLISDDTIQVSGCTLFGLACKTQHWTRLR